MERHNNGFITGLGIALIMLCLLLSHDVPAQTLNLYDAVQKTMSNYPLLKQREAEVAAGKAHITTINGNRLPSLILQDEATLGTDNSMEGAYFSMGMVPSTPGSNSIVRYNPIPGNIAITFLQWQFYTFGYYNAQQREAKAQLSVNEANLNSAQYQLSVNMVTLYLDWLKKYRLLLIQQENVERAQVMLTAIRATVLSGLKPGVDSSTANASFADARISYLQALNAYNDDRISILTYTGLDSGNIAPDTTALAHLPVDNPGPTATSIVPADHPLIETYQKQYEQQLAANNTIAKKYLPKIGIDGAAWERASGISATGVYPDNLSANDLNSKYNYLFGLTATYNLFNIKHRHDELAEGNYAAQAKQAARETQQLTLNNMLKQANEAYTTTLQQLAIIPVQMQSAREAYGQQTALYRAGLNTLIEVTNAQYMLLQAETNYVLTQDEMLQILYIRAALSGQSTNFLQNFKR